MIISDPFVAMYNRIRHVPNCMSYHKASLVNIYIYIYKYIYERETSVCMCYTITVKQKTQRLFDEFSYSFNTKY